MGTVTDRRSLTTCILTVALSRPGGTFNLDELYQIMKEDNCPQQAVPAGEMIHVLREVPHVYPITGIKPPLYWWRHALVPWIKIPFDEN